MLRIRADELQEQLHPEEPLKKWRCQFEQNTLTEANFIQFFMHRSANFFELETGPDRDNDLGKCTFDERGAKVGIIEVIEEFICGDNPQTVFDKLKSENNYPSVCGRVFKGGEPTYSCRECGLDPTCVLCVSCFKQSAHRHHKYKMGTSNGGGCCDCGDVEAWKRDAFCDEHILGTEKNEESSVITERMKKCCYLVFQAVLQYCTKSLEIESNASLQCLDGGADDVYCTVLYNDETHTFEQVIQTLTRIVGCRHKDATEYVTLIDREGRAVVKCSTFMQCMRLKDDIEKNVSRSALQPRAAPLNVGVLHKNSVAHQQFAIQLLGWFQEFLTRHAIFRKIFCEVAMQDTSYNIAHILSYDSKLWKTARTSWHRLLISGMLMEYDNKKALAIMFTKQYTNLMQEYIRDDHEHSFSVCSLSVQLFTVPTIANHLIAHESAFFKLMHTFYSECIEKYVSKKVLVFSKNTANLNIFKRACYILYDLKYLLSFKPDVWTDDLRRGYLHGVQILLRLLSAMQGMDAVSRQIGQHMEYEPEWESAFTLHIKLANIITLVLDWCSTDKVVLVKVYRMILAQLQESEFILSKVGTEVKELADHSTSCYMYDVLSKFISIHLPLSRFFAGLYLHLEKFGITFDNITINSIKPTPEQIIEPVLCTQTMIAQVHAGLWRRNGYSLLNQLHFYRNVRCRSEMLDRDITVLQIGASLIESNEFLIHIMNKFNLIDWVNADFEKTLTTDDEDDLLIRTIYMIDEFLELLIVVIGERYVPGVGNVTEEDRLKKEIIQQLCIKPYSHSELNRTLPEMQQGIGIEAVIDQVAIFKKPTQSGKKGYYVLKDEFYDDYNMYFYHYTKEDRSISEEAQRKRKKGKNERVCCPPPNLPQLSESFHMMANLLQCDVMLLVMRTVLKRSLDLSARSFTESHLQKALHLIGYAIREQMSNNYPFLIFAERAKKWEILKLLEELSTSLRVEAHRDLILWTIQKYKEMLSANSDEKVEDVTATVQTEDTSMATATSSEQAEKEERSRIAAERRAKILAQMTKAQNKFVTSNADLFEATKLTADDDEDEAGIVNQSVENTAMDWQEDDASKSIACLGPNKKNQPLIQSSEERTCILCSEDSTVSKDGPCLVYCAFIQKSSVLSRYQKTNESGQLMYLETAIHPSPHTSTCGHVMHATCWLEYFNNEVIKENRRPYRNRSPSSFDVEKKEFLCPLCRCISNSVIPLMPELRRFTAHIASDPTAKMISFDEWIDVMKEYSRDVYNEPFGTIVDLSSSSPNLAARSAPVSSLETTLNKLGKNVDQFYKISQVQDEKLSREICDHIQMFMDSVKRVAPYLASAAETEPYLVTWLSCAYTIESLEMLLRALEKPLKDNLSIRYTACLSGLVRLCSLMGIASKNIEPKLVYQMKDLYDTVFARKGMSVLSWDVFGMLLSLLYITPCTIYSNQKKLSIPKGDMLEYYILKLMFLANMSRIVIVYEPPETCNEMEVEDDVTAGAKDTATSGISEQPSTSAAAELHSAGSDEAASASTPTESDDSKLLQFYKKHKIFDGNVVGERVPITTANLIDEIKKQSETFLRCSCLLFHFMTDIEMPDEFAYLGGDTFDLMCEYLGLSSNVETYFENEKMNEFMTSLVTHADVTNYKLVEKMTKESSIVPIMSSVPPIRQLVALPDDYSDLINSVSMFSCPNYDSNGGTWWDSRNPTMCLVCGEIVCSQTYCCQKELDKVMVGACTYHAHICGAGVGMFLKIRECEILLLGLNKGCLCPPPYLDEYGETDEGLRRGNPLHLCKDRYRKLHLMWLGHGLHEEIARLNESQNAIFGIQWHHL